MLVHDDDVREPADFEQLMPVRRGACQSRNFERQQRTDQPANDVFRETFEARPSLDTGSTLAEVFIDDLDAFSGPT